MIGEQRPLSPEGGSPSGNGDAARVAQGSALLVTARIVGNAGFFVAVLVLARALDVPHRGQFAFITTAAQVLSLVACFGVTQATTVFAAKEPELRARLLANLLVFVTLSTSVVAAVVCTTLALLHEPSGATNTDLMLLGLGAVVSSLTSAGNAFLAGCGRWRAQALVSAAAPWLYALLLGLTWLGPKLSTERSLLIFVILYGAWAAAVLTAVARESRIGRPSRTLMVRSLRFGIRAWVGSVMLLLNYRTDQVLMGFIASSAALGVYAIAVNASEMLFILPSATTTALVPILARSAVASRTDRTAMTFRLLSTISVVSMIVAGACGSILLPIVFGSRYQASVVPFIWLVAGTIGFVASDVFSSALLATSSPGLASLASTTSLVVGFALDFALIPSFGATGAAAAATAAFYAGGVTGFFAYRRRAGLPYRLLVPRRSDLELARSLAATLLSSSRRWRAFRSGSAAA